MRKLVLILGVAAFLLPVCLTSCQKEEVQPYGEELNITKADGMFIDFVATINHGFTMVRVTGYIALGPDGEIIGGYITITTIPADPNVQPKTYYFSYYSQELHDSDDNELSMEEVFPGLLEIIQNYVSSL